MNEFNTILPDTSSAFLKYSLLKSKGYLKSSISGTFGKKTEKAVIKFKKKHNLGGKKPSSVVGEKTIKALKNGEYTLESLQKAVEALKTIK